MQDELTLFRKMQEGDWNAFNFRVLLGTVIPLRVRFCREPGGSGGHRAGYVYLPMGQPGENLSLGIDLCLFKSFSQEFLY